MIGQHLERYCLRGRGVMDKASACEFDPLDIQMFFNFPLGDCYGGKKESRKKYKSSLWHTLANENKCKV